MRIKLENCISIDEDDIKKYIAQEYEPEDIFDADTLAYWAKENNYVLKSTED